MTLPLQDRLALAFVFFVAAIARPIVMTKRAERVRVRNEDPRIVQIRQLQHATEHALPTYRKAKRDLEGFSAEGGELTAYFAADTLEKLEGQFFGESGRATEQFYVHDGAHARGMREEHVVEGRMRGAVERSVHALARLSFARFSA